MSKARNTISTEPLPPDYSWKDFEAWEKKMKAERRRRFNMLVKKSFGESDKTK